MISRRYCLNLWRVEQKVPQVKQVQVQQEQEVNEMRSQLVFHCQAPPCHCMLMSRLLTQSQHEYICKQCKDGYGIGYFLLTNVLCGRDFIGLSDEWLNKFRGQLGKEEAPVYFPPTLLYLWWHFDLYLNIYLSPTLLYLWWYLYLSPTILCLCWHFNLYLIKFSDRECRIHYPNILRQVFLRPINWSVKKRLAVVNVKF